jgi:hypothetical protein
MSARRRAQVVPIPTPPAAHDGGFTEHEMELSNLAGAVRMIKYGLDASQDTETTDEALSHLEQCLRRLSDQVGDTERRLGWRPEGGA